MGSVVPTGENNTVLRLSFILCVSPLRVLSLTYRIPSPGKFSVPSRGCNACIVFALCSFVKRVLSPRGDELFPEFYNPASSNNEFPSPRGDELFLVQARARARIRNLVSAPSRG